MYTRLVTRSLTRKFPRPWSRGYFSTRHEETRRKLVHIYCLWKINSRLKIIRLQNWFVFTRDHCVVSVYKKSRKSATEVTHVTVRDWTKGGLHVIWKLAVVMFLSKTQRQNEELGLLISFHGELPKLAK